MHTSSPVNQAMSQPNERATAPPAAIAFSRLPGAAALTAAGAAGADVLVYQAAAVLWDVPGAFSALSPGSIIVNVVAGVLVATLGLAGLARLTRRAVPLFVAAAVVVTLLSLMGPFQAMAGGMPGLAPATTPTGVTMLLLHVLTGGIIAGVLPVQARP